VTAEPGPEGLLKAIDGRGGGNGAGSLSARCAREGWTGGGEEEEEEAVEEGEAGHDGGFNVGGGPASDSWLIRWSEWSGVVW
jgi:hypothetical protein